MTSINARTIWRGNPIAYDNNPNPVDIVKYLEQINLTASMSGTMRWADTLAELNAKTTSLGDTGFVLGGVDAGIYERGAVDFGAKIADLPLAFAYQNVDDTADVDKPVSTAQAAAIEVERLARIAGDDAVNEGVYFAGPWDASSGAFPTVRAQGGAVQNGDVFDVSGAGTVDGVVFAVGERIMALVDGPSSSTYAANWYQSQTIAALSPITARVTDLEGIAPYDSIASLTASTKISIGDIVETRGYYAPGDGGGNFYRIVAAATGTVDGGSYIDLTGIAGQAMGLFDDGTTCFEQFGANGIDDGIDDLIPMRSAINYTKANGLKLLGEDGATYRYTDTLDASQPSGNGIAWSMDLGNAIMLQDFNGHDQIGLRYSVAGARAGGGKKILTGGFFKNGPLVTSPPIMVDLSGTANLIYDNLHFSGSANTQLRADSNLNNRPARLMSYYGGVHFPYRDTTGVTFTTTAGVGTVTASVAHFVAGDVGKIKTLTRADGTTEAYTFTGYTSPTVMTCDASSVTVNFAGATGNWEGARVSVTGTTATIDGEDWPANVVGLSIYIAGAKTGGNPLRRTIATRTSGSIVELDTAVDVNVTDALFGLTAIDFGSDAAYADAQGSVETNFVTMSELFIENPRGIAMVVNDASNFSMIQSKIHGEAQPDGNTGATVAHIWAIEWNGEYSGTLEADFTGPAKVMAFGQVGALSFDGQTRVFLGKNQNLVNMYNTQAGGGVRFDNVALIGSVNAVDTLKSNIAAESGNMRVGTITQSGRVGVVDSDRPRGFLGITDDANVAYSVSFAEPPNIRDTAALTALRELTLGANGMQTEGDVVRYTCKTTGGFDRRIRNGPDNFNMAQIATDEWADFTFTGANWYLSARGSLV
tara:strand:+ start:24114 stop:26735 length:2622 start_codon:yes stop_codon:yes gene_type:complete